MIPRWICTQILRFRSWNRPLYPDKQIRGIFPQKKSNSHQRSHLSKTTMAADFGCPCISLLYCVYLATEAGLEPTTPRLTANEFPSPSTAIDCCK